MTMKKCRRLGLFTSNIIIIMVMNTMSQTCNVHVKHSRQGTRQATNLMIHQKIHLLCSFLGHKMQMALDEFKVNGMQRF